MRIYYVFNIKDEICSLTRKTPYMLFKSLEAIFTSRKDDYFIASNLYNEMVCKFDKSKINKEIQLDFKDNINYRTYLDNHYYNNKYKDEDCEINIKNSFLLCKTNTCNLILLKGVSDKNLFVCDFENKDYFWLNEIYC